MSDNKDVFIIEGLAGKKKLKGKIRVGGAKNAVLKVLASSVLFKDRLTISNVPAIEDVTRTLEVLQDLGVSVAKENDHSYVLDPRGLNKYEISREISKKLRASIVLTGPLLARFGKVIFPYPGGCVIGKRPIDLFLTGFRAMGATVTEKDGLFTVTAPGKKLKGAEIFFKNPSVTATETFMMAAVLAKGKTLLRNAAQEPEIVSLGEFLQSCGAQLSGLGTSTIEISGEGLLSGVGKEYETIPDRIEAGSFLIMAALCGEDVEVTHCEPKHLDSLITLLQEAGVTMKIGKNSIKVTNRHTKPFQAVDVKTHEYPGFPTDLQAPMAVFQTQAAGQSFIFETIFEGRLNYLETLNQMGAKTRLIDAHRALIDGPAALKGRQVESPDLRAGLAYVLAGIIAKGQTLVHNVYYIDRGYEQIETRLRQIGVNIKRLK